MTNRFTADLATYLESIHFDGKGCGTNSAGACSNCFGPSPMSAADVAEEITRWLNM